MKKTLRTLLILMLALMLPMAVLATGAEEALIPEHLGEEDIIGSWRMTALIMEDMRLTPEMMGMEMIIEFRADHTVTGTFSQTTGDNGQAEETWSLDVEKSLICVSGSPYLKVRQEDGQLFLLMDEEITEAAAGEMIFTRAEA